MAIAFLKGLFGGRGSSKSAAKNRLQFVLVQDRAGLSNDEMSAFKQELIQVVERYFEIDESGFDIDYQRSGDTTTLLINSPVIVKRSASLDGRRAKAANSNLGSRGIVRGELNDTELNEGEDDLDSDSHSMGEVVNSKRGLNSPITPNNSRAMRRARRRKHMGQ